VCAGIGPMTKASIDSISFCGPEHSLDLELHDDHMGKDFDDIFFLADESPHSVLDDPFQNSSSSSLDGAEPGCSKDKSSDSATGASQSARETAETAEKGAQQGCALVDVLTKVLRAGCRSARARTCGEDASAKGPAAQAGVHESPFPVAGNEMSYSVLVE